jgi:ATP sulfurylase
LVKELKEKILNIPGDDGTPLNTTIFTREKDYDGEARNSAPDLVVYFDNLQYGCNTSLIGNETLWSPSTAMGSDDAVHSRKGIFIINKKEYSGKIDNMKITDPAKIILDEFNYKDEKIKIICTIGPASESKEVLEELRENGMDYARINLSHVEFAEAKKIIDHLSSLNLSIILDTQGKEIRINENENVFLIEGSLIDICDDKKGKISFSRDGIIKELKVGEKILIDDEKITLEIEMIDNNQAFCRVIKGGELKKNRVVKIGHRINLEPLTQRDKEIISYGVEKGVKTIALSFADSKRDIQKIKLLFPGIEIIPKIENMPGVLNVEEICEEVDTLWIDRFDLGTFIGFEKVPLVQKMIIKKCKSMNKNVIIASHLLETMIKEGVPTRAEINDIANTILDGASGLVLAAETAVGKNPVDSIKVLKKIIDDITSKDTEDIFDKIESSKMLKKLKEIGYINEDISPSSLSITKENLMDIICLSNDSFYPLKEFVDRENYQNILDNMKLKTGEIWSIPITLNVDKEKADSLEIGEEISLLYENEEVAKLELKEKYVINKEEYCLKVFGTLDKEHPGVKEIMKQGDVALSGKIRLIKNPISNKYSLSPEQVKKIINDKNLKTVVAFHTRNPIHRSHEFLQRTALEQVDGLLVQPVIGKKKTGDFEEEYIIKSYEIMMEKFYPKDRVIFCTVPTYSRYAGPREAVFTALLRRNFGATHFIVGRDHTGVGNFYEKYDSQKIFDKLGDVGIKIIKFHAPFYCNICKQYVTEHTCSHEDRIDISGTKIREMLNQGIFPPEEVMRSEISDMIVKDIKSGKRVFVE